MCDPQGEEVFISSFSNGCIAVVKRDGSVQRTIGSEASKDGKLKCCMGLALCGELVFVADSDNSRIVVFNKSSGEFVRSFGSSGEGDGQFNGLWGVAVSADAREVFASDHRAHRIQVL